MAKRILIYELNWLGDILFSFPLLKALKGSGDKPYISCVVVPRYKDLLAENPWVDEIVELSDDRGVSSWLEKLMFILRIRKRKYGLAILLKPSRTKALMSFLAGIPRRLSFKGKNTLVTDSVDVDEIELHRVDQLLSFSQVLGVECPDKEYEFILREKDMQRAEHLLSIEGSSNSQYIAVHPGGNWEAKRWDKEKFVSLIKKIIESKPDVEVIVTGAAKDQALAYEMIEKVGSKRCITVSGKTDLRTLAALFKNSKCVISADSGPMHLSSSVQANTVALFGPTLPGITGPRGKGRNIVLRKEVKCELPCYEETCGKKYECMGAISVDDVYKAVMEVVGSRE